MDTKLGGLIQAIHDGIQGSFYFGPFKWSYHKLSETCSNLTKNTSVRGILPDHFLFRASVTCCALWSRWFGPSPRVRCRSSSLLTYLDPLLQPGPWRCSLGMICRSVFGSAPWSSAERVLLPSSAPDRASSSHGSVWCRNQSLSPLCVDWIQRIKTPNCYSEFFDKMKSLKGIFIHWSFIHSFVIHCMPGTEDTEVKMRHCLSLQSWINGKGGSNVQAALCVCDLFIVYTVDIVGWTFQQVWYDKDGICLTKAINRPSKVFLGLGDFASPSCSRNIQHLETFLDVKTGMLLHRG